MFPEHLQRLADLISVEAEAEKQLAADRLVGKSPAVAESNGEALVDLAIEDESPGLGQRFVVSFVKRNRSLDLPWTRLRVGSPVLLSEVESDESVRGVVVRRDRRVIQVSVDELPMGERFRLDLAADEITRQRQIDAMNRAGKAERGRLAILRDVLMGQRTPRFGDLPQLKFFSNLSDSQRDAVQFALSAEELGIVHGPPGTGKTTTVVEIIRQAVLAGDSVLACGPSNHAADHLASKLSSAGLNVVRVGHPARVQESLQTLTLDSKVAQQDRVKVARDCVKEAMQLQRKASRFTRARPQPGEKRAWREAARELFAEARRYERLAIQEVLDAADVVCGTTAIDPALMGERRFDYLVIDECCQSTEPGCWVPLQFADRLILAGDHCQLPPTVISYQASQDGLSTSLQERLVDLYGDSIFRRLTTQYRSHQKIMQFSSEHFYEGQLQAAPQVAEQCLADFAAVPTNGLTQQVVEFFDTAGADFDEEKEPDGASRLNPREARFVLMKVQQLLDAGLEPEAIGVIAPYSAQVRYLQAACEHDCVEIDSVDGFQGREKEAIIFSAVRSNRQGEIGFLKDVRRTNVALTRARRKLIFVGDSATLGKHAFYSDLIDYFQSLDAHRSVWEEPID
ncbi:MAG: AAA family ATPase [Planctomycetaceae bacterium]|nr:AAA family ATPase [Planctomycetaceae bacterium]